VYTLETPSLMGNITLQKEDRLRSHDSSPSTIHYCLLPMA
jgi:hypothetical protein